MIHMLRNPFVISILGRKVSRICTKVSNSTQVEQIVQPRYIHISCILVLYFLSNMYWIFSIFPFHLALKGRLS